MGPDSGCVYLVGAGPGDPELATVKSLRLLGAADCVVYDALASGELLNHVREDAELIDAGKRASDHTMSQDQINALLAERAIAGQKVVRLKGGDPYVFGRGSEEMLYLVSRGVRVEVVPGVTAGLAATAYAGIPVTHRRIAPTVTFVTGHEDPDKPGPQVDYAALARLTAAGGTLCFYMGMARLREIVDKLIAEGVGADTPAAVVQWGTLPAQRSVHTGLNALPDAAARQGLAAPAVIVVGPVAQAGPEGALCWFETRELFGQTVLITRSRDQASSFRRRLELLGATVLEAPTLELEDPDDWSEVDAAIRSAPEYDWLALTSA
ncbi:MAG: uroporphyrinogen-III C-methyltransferase, partial [Planctomycetota bacterium]